MVPEADGMRVEELQDLGIDRRFVEIWQRAGITVLTEIQERAFRHPRFLEDANLLIVAPTSSGKTFIGEVLAIATASRMKRVVYLGPFKAMAEEKYQEFRERCGPEGISVVISSGDYAEFDDDIHQGNYNIAIVVFEKLAQLVVQGPGITTNCGLVVVDEIQMVRDKGRGPKLEMLLTKIRLGPDRPRIVGLSAVMRDLNQFDQWLAAEIISSDVRPVPLMESVCDSRGHVWTPAPGLPAQASEEDLSGVAVQDQESLTDALALHFANRGDQVLIFRATKDQSETTARRLSQRLPISAVRPETAYGVGRLEESGVRAFLQDALPRRVAYHNADLSAEERLLVERLFRTGELRVLVSTTTLATGVNLPADVVIVADYQRWDPNARGRRPIPVSEYKNAAGRAGRFGMRTLGRSFLLATNPFEARQLLANFVRGELEQMDSAIPFERDFGHHVLTVVASGIARVPQEILQIFTESYAFRTFYFEAGGLENAVTTSLARCRELGLIQAGGGRDQLEVTEVGRAVARAGISLETFEAIRQFFDGLTGAGVGELDLLFHLSRCPEAARLAPYLRAEERGTNVFRQNVPLQAEDLPPTSHLRVVLTRRGLPSEEENQALKKALLMEAWRRGERLKDIERSFRVALGVIRGLGETLGWLVEATGEIVKGLGFPLDLVGRLGRLAGELKFGVPQEVVSIAKLRVPGMGRDKIIRLINNERGARYTSPDQILDATPDDFRGIIEPALATELQRAILATYGESLRRKERGHLMRVQRLTIPRTLIERLYEARGRDLEEAVASMLDSEQIAIPCTRIATQRRAEADIHLHHQDGTLVMQVTASDDNAKPIPWDKCREVFGSAAGHNPIGFIVLGRPGFHEMAISHAETLADPDPRHLLLLPVDMFVEACVRVLERTLTRDRLIEILRNTRGHLSSERLAQLVGTPAQATQEA